MTSSIRFIVLTYTKFGENSIVLHTISREYGRKGFLVRLGKRAPMSLFQPLSILDAEITENPKAALWPARNFSPAWPLTGIRTDMYKNSMTMFMSEVLYRIIKDGTNEEGLFDWCVRSVMTLEGMESDFSNFHIRFLLELAVVLGFSPSEEDMAPFSGEHLASIRMFMEKPFEEAMLIPLTGEDRNGICEDILKYLEFHTESAINIKSLSVLRELYR